MRLGTPAAVAGLSTLADRADDGDATATQMPAILGFGPQTTLHALAAAWHDTQARSY
jgi:hypothetical protein